MAKRVQSKYGYEPPEWVRVDARLDRQLKRQKRLAKRRGVLNQERGKTMKNKVEESTINSILENAQIETKTVFSKVTIVTAKLPNGFVLVESSGAVSEENYDAKIGKKVCMDRIKNKIWELEGYKLASQLMEER
ncbi:Gp49 family protein [Lactiplantibacillus mudanjiangensis]|uniref:Uncharacterized protein n=1 Tax=Lactiplantibacillus mudanjiangensis TaxID=1296538 RepID=A0A660E087_9LACO|nr:Gp49 family protein [Lactiplantibacillus mudanjiangensis]VDG23681.1 hypothetical protein [Lactobacillus allii] [Lactiplantibacillus mudanjiangensis]VDG27824.1 hypothetical protein [Lactobacillus allii] [Lactiplantibacillus mudanjiangensis]